MQKLELDQVYIVEAHFHDVFVSLSPFVCPFPNQTGKTTIKWTMQTNNNIWYHKKTTIYDIIRRQDNSCQDKSRQLDQSNYNQTSLKYQRTHAVPNLDVSMHLIRIQHFEYRIHKYLQCSIIYFLAFVCVWNIQHQNWMPKLLDLCTFVDCQVSFAERLPHFQVLGPVLHKFMNVWNFLRPQVQKINFSHTLAQKFCSFYCVHNFSAGNWVLQNQLCLLSTIASKLTKNKNKALFTTQLSLWALL